MVLRQAQSLAAAILVVIGVTALASVLLLGAGYPLVTISGAARPLTAFEAALALPIVALAYHKIYWRISRVRRWRRNLVRAGGAFATSWVGTIALLLAKQLTAVIVAVGVPVDQERTLAVVIGMLLLWRANLLPKSRPGWLNGVALPVFASDSTRWCLVHRYAAVRVAGIGGVALLLAFFAPAGFDVRTPIIVLLAAELLVANTHALLLPVTRR